MKRLTIIACCVVIFAVSYVFGAKTMTHTWEDIDAAITKFLTMDTAAELEVLLSLQNLQGAVTDAQVPNDITINAENVSVTDADENFAGTDAEAVLDELYDTKEPSQTPAGQAEMEAGTETAIRSMSPLRVAQAIAAQVDTSARTVTAHGSVSSGTEDFSPGIHTVTVSGVFAWAFTSWPASGTEGVVRAYITNGGSASFTGWGDVVWEGGVAPTLQASGLDVVTFTSLDGGTTVYGFLAGEDMQ